LLNYIVKRFLNFLLLVVLASTLGYFLAAIALNPRSNYEGRNPPLLESTIEKKLSDLNMNDKTPVVTRYFTWVGGVVQGDLGTTLNEKSVNSEIGRRIWVSLRLLLLGSIIGSVLGVIAGVVSAVRQYKPFDRYFSIASYIFLSAPVFLIALLLKFGAINLNDRLVSIRPSSKVLVSPRSSTVFSTSSCRRCRSHSAASRSTRDTNATRCSTCCRAITFAPLAPRASPSVRRCFVTVCALQSFR
jgi:ABC-type dipeptide/oligopeptide/nickel transport system permease component